MMYTFWWFLMIIIQSLDLETGLIAFYYLILPYAWYLLYEMGHVKRKPAFMTIVAVIFVVYTYTLFLYISNWVLHLDTMPFRAFTYYHYLYYRLVAAGGCFYYYHANLNEKPAKAVFLVVLYFASVSFVSPELSICWFGRFGVDLTSSKEWWYGLFP